MIDARGEATDGEGAVEFESFFRDQRLPSLRLAWFLTSGRVDVEDVVQTALVRVGAHFDELVNPAAYLRVAVLNACREADRKRLRDRRRERFEQQVDVSWMRSDIEILSVVGVLPHPLREVIVLRYWLDRSDIEIASELGIRPATVRTRVHRALN